MGKGRASPWAGAPEAKPVQVQYDLDWSRFIELFMERMEKKRNGTVMNNRFLTVVSGSDMAKLA